MIHPICVGASRAAGTYKPTSDWDVQLIADIPLATPWSEVTKILKRADLFFRCLIDDFDVEVDWWVTAIDGGGNRVALHANRDWSFDKRAGYKKFPYSFSV